MNASSDLIKSLDNFEEKILAFQISEAMDEMADLALDLKNTLTKDEWNNLVVEVRKHSILKTIHNDPFSRHSFERPYGYAGDAKLIDLIYYLGNSKEVVARSSKLGQEFYKYATNRPAPVAVRDRLFKAKELLENTRGHILSVASGHMREAELIDWENSSIELITALDQDPSSLSVISQTHGEKVKLLQNSVLDIIKNRAPLQSYDLIYSLGLFDYLDQKVATKLIDSLYSKLNPGGKLVIANFTPNLKDIGYMELFMDWELIYRDEESMNALKSNYDGFIYDSDNKTIKYLSIFKN
jgi:SAM-dependent methyltransferase